MSSFTLLFMATVHTRDHFIISRVQTVVLFPLLSARLLMNRFVYCSQQREDRIALNFKQMPWLKQLLFAPPSLRTMYFHLQFRTVAVKKRLWRFSTVCPYRVAVVLRKKLPASASAVVILSFVMEKKERRGPYYTVNGRSHIAL